MVSRPGKIEAKVPPVPNQLKLCIVGDSEVGKTAFCKGFQGQAFPERYEPTVGSDYFSRLQKCTSGQYQFNVWDLSGEQEYLEVRNEFYKESQAVIIMFDLTRKGTFDALDMWLREISKHGGENLPVFVVGNKSDTGSKRKVTKDDAEKWVKFRKFEGYFETSAKDGHGYLQLFAAVAEKCS